MSDVKVKFGAEDENLTSTLNKVQKELKQVESQADKTSANFGGGFAKMAAAATVAGSAMAVGFAAIKASMAAITASAGLLKDSVVSASDMGETISKVGQIFGKSGKDIESWASTSSSAMGQSKQQAMDAASQFAIFGKAAGLSGSSLTGFSKELTELATDLSSFNNTSPEEAILAIGSALRGEAEPMRRFGVLLDDASLRNEALKMGLIATTKDALTPQQKVLAAHALIMAQTSAAQGDFERTSGGFANQSKILTAKIKDLGVEIGGFLLPAITNVTAAINQYAMPAVSGFIKQFQGMGAGDWGQKMIGMVIRVADTMLGAFTAPLKAVDAIGSALNAGVREMGSAILNAYITGFEFVKKFWASELPGLLIGQLGNALMAGFSTGIKFFVDKIKESADGFKQFFADSISKVVVFFADTLGKVTKFFAEDFKNAVSNPIDFISGKLKSALGDASESGAMTFVDNYQNANGSVLDKLSTGLGAAADVYSKKMAEGTSAIQGEFNKIISDITPSATNFFGAKEATVQMKEDFVKMELSGKKMREGWMGVNAEAQSTNAAVANIALNSERTSVATKETKKDMIEIKTIGDLIDAREKAPEKGSYSQRWKQAKKDAKDYEDYLGGDFSNRSIRDMAKAMKIDTANKESGELLDMIEKRMEGIKGIEIPLKMSKDATKDQIDEMNDLFAAGFKALELKLGTEEALKTLNGIAEKTFDLNLDADKSIEALKDKLKQPIEVNLQPKGSDGKDSNATLEAIKSAVETIRTLVAKIEPKLPQTALAQ